MLQSTTAACLLAALSTSSSTTSTTCANKKQCGKLALLVPVSLQPHQARAYIQHELATQCTMSPHAPLPQQHPFNYNTHEAARKMVLCRCCRFWSFCCPSSLFARTQPQSTATEPFAQREKESTPQVSPALQRHESESAAAAAKKGFRAKKELCQTGHAFSASFEVDFTPFCAAQFNPWCFMRDLASDIKYKLQKLQR